MKKWLILGIVILALAIGSFMLWQTNGSSNQQIRITPTPSIPMRRDNSGSETDIQDSQNHIQRMMQHIGL